LKNNSILLLGSSGTLGSNVLKNNYFKNCIKPTSKVLNLKKKDSITKFFSKNNIKTIIHCAAISSMKKCQDNPTEAINTNVIGTQNLVEVKRGVRVNTERKIFPGYILIKMNLNDDTWHIIKNTPKLSGFLGNKGKPVPISNSEAKRISEQVIDGVERSRPAIMYDVGEQVKVIDGPFASFNGEIEQIDEEKARLRVAVSIFGRSTPVDLEYSQVEKV